MNIKPKTLHLSNGREGVVKCPMCGGGVDNVMLRTVGGSGAWVKHCYQCGGFWFERPPTEILSFDSISRVDVPTPNYSLKNLDMVCPNDSSLLVNAEGDDLPVGAQYWRCSDCDGMFYPKGQLALLSQHQHDIHAERIAGILNARSQTTIAFLLISVGVVAANAAVQRVNLTLSATVTEQVLPTNGPNILTLILLGATYLAGTVLAVLGRKIPLILMGWSVILICLVGFSIIIFGP